jgi:predicted DNA-binding ribbon-helix-helix protein
MSVARFVSILHDEILERTGEVANFASFLRVACLHWLRNPDLHAAQLSERAETAAAMPVGKCVVAA